MKRKTKYQKSKARAIKNLAQYKNEDGTQKENSIERRIRVLLDSMGLYYEQEKRLTWKGKTRYFDFYITDGLNRFIIEAMGKYWHAFEYHEGLKKKMELTKLQRKNLRNDKFKAQMTQALGIPVLYLWEDEIKNNIESIKTKILTML